MIGIGCWVGAAVCAFYLSTCFSRARFANMALGSFVQLLNYLYSSVHLSHISTNPASPASQSCLVFVCVCQNKLFKLGPEWWAVQWVDCVNHSNVLALKWSRHKV